MTPRSRHICTVVCVAAVSLTHGERQTLAQPRSFTLEQVLDYPFPANLTAAGSSSTIAWTFAERGARNLYIADGPEYKARRATSYNTDDGQELTNVLLSRDGRRVVYVRGGDHGANWPAEGNLQPNPASSAVQQKMQVWSVSTSGGAPVLLGDGDAPALSPDGSRVAFVNNHRIWIAPAEGGKEAEAFFARGSSESPRWSPDSKSLAFVSDRDDHSFIAIFTDGAQPIRYLSASTSRDVDPVWSPDGRTIAFIRMPGRGGTPRSPLQQQPQPWSIMLAPADGSAPAREVWKSGGALVDSVPRTADDRNLRWAADGRLVFISYQDGWPHLYSVQLPTGGAPAPAAKLLTPGAFMVEDVALSADGRAVFYSANAGGDRLDVDRRHLFRVPVDGSSAPAAVTRGAGLEWAPAPTGDGHAVAFLKSTAQQSPLPAVVPSTDGEARTLAADRVPPAFPAASLVTPEQVLFKAADGTEIHGQLFRAAGASSAAKRPALVYVHGGPPRQMLLGWHYMDYYANDYAANQYLASRGFIVLSVNYRLGIGYGHAFHYPERGGARGAAEYQDVLAGGRYLQSRPDVDAARIGIWGGSYGGYLTALALGRNSDLFAAGVDIHGVHDRIPAVNTEMLARAIVGDGITEADYRQALKVAYESSPIASVPTWRSPVLLIHGDDDRNVQFHQTVDLKSRLLQKGVTVEELVIPDDIHDFLLWKSWRAVTTAAGDFFDRQLLRRGTGSPQ